LGIFPKSVDKLQDPLQSDNNNRCCTCRPVLYMYGHIALISS